jgi:arabinose-5-phosphate isomerase
MNIDTSNIIHEALQTIQKEAAAIQSLTEFINEDFVQAVYLLKDCKGRIVLTGIGKSAIIAQKITATFNSTGTPAIFMHAADAIHGDLGMIQPEDVVICISKSGESPEIKILLPLIKNFKTPVIAIVGNLSSSLAKQADYVLNTTVSREACPNNLAPTASTTAQLVMGDALAVCLMQLNGFTAEDFAKFHPGGTLGKKLYLHVRDLALNNDKPTIHIHSPIPAVIMAITGGRLGIVIVTDDDEKLCGVITDGDLRRMMEKNANFESLRAMDIMTHSPKTIQENELAVNALEKMRGNNITQLVVLNSEKVTGIIHLHDLIREGLI